MRRRRWSARRVGSGLGIAGLVAAAAVVVAVPGVRTAAAAGPPTVAVAYAEGSRSPASGALPTPWVDDPSVVAIGSGPTGSCCLDDGVAGWDTAAVLVRAPADAALHVASVSIDIGPVHVAPWPGGVDLVPGQAAIFTGQIGGPWTDLSEWLGHVCHAPDPTLPVVTVDAGGVVRRFVDAGRVLTSGGYDPSSCDHGVEPREGRPWQDLGPPETVGPTAPPATVEASGCGDGVHVVEVECGVVSAGAAVVGADGGSAGTGVALDAPGARVDVHLSVPATGTYQPVLRYRADGAPFRQLLVDGAAVGQVALQPTATGWSRAAVQLHLGAGPHVLSLVNGAWGHLVADAWELLTWPADPRLPAPAPDVAGPPSGGAPAGAVPASDEPSGDAASTFVPLDPVRALDTRLAGGPLGPAATNVVPVAGRFGVPDGATAVVVNVTGTGASHATYLTTWPAGRPRPTASTLNLAPGDTRADLAVVALGDGGIALYNDAGRTDVVVDVLGALVPVGTGGGRFHTAGPRRVLDTRLVGGPVGPAGRVVDVTAPAGIDPAHVRAVVANVTAVDAVGAGYLTVHPADQPPPLASNLNVLGAGARANLAIVRTDAAGRWRLSTDLPGVHVIIDVIGWIDDGAPGLGGAAFVPRAPVRVLDTRTTGAPVVGGSDRTVALAGPAAAPPDTVAVLVNATAVSASAPAYLTLHPGGSTVPGVSTLNVEQAGTVPNAAVVATPGAGAGAAYLSAGTADLVVDVSGWFVPA